jgi:biopolymer transport protein TolR
MALSMSKRARRMDSHHRRLGRSALNLVSLMDIFTILVFFLLVNSSDVEVTPDTKLVQIPESVTEQKPRETVVVMVTPERIYVQGEPVADARIALASKSDVIGPLKVALQSQAARLIDAADAAPAAREVMIMGDKTVPFQLLKKIMATCTDAAYERISLAVVNKARASTTS